MCFVPEDLDKDTPPLTPDTPSSSISSLSALSLNSSTSIKANDGSATSSPDKGPGELGKLSNTPSLPDVTSEIPFPSNTIKPNSIPNLTVTRCFDSNDPMIAVNNALGEPVLGALFNFWNNQTLRYTACYEDIDRKLDYGQFRFAKDHFHD